MNNSSIGASGEMASRERGHHRQLRVFLFGRFEVACGTRSLVEGSRKNSKPWALFKYLLTGSQKMVSTGSIMEALWPDSSTESPQSLHLCVHRLRRLLRCDLEIGESTPRILGDNGAYGFNWDGDYWVDVLEFERLHREAKKEQSHAQNSQKLYQEALALYVGDCLVEHEDEPWAVEVREHYRMVYKSAVLDYTDLLMRLGHYFEVKTVCDAAKLPQADEDVECQVIRSLIYQGDLKQARKRYERITSILYQDMGIAPSAKLRTLYRLLVASEEGHHYIDIQNHPDALTLLASKTGAVVCDGDVFRHLCAIETRKSARGSHGAYLVCLVIKDAHGQWPGHQQAQTSSGILVQALQDMLRRGDTICRWNQYQILLLVSLSGPEGAARLEERIQERLIPLARSMSVQLDVSLRQLEVDAG